MNPASSIPHPAAIYRRVSTDHQDGSLEVQEQRVLQYAAYKGLTTNEGHTFSDPDTSGSIPILKRDGGRALINRLKLGDIKHLIIAKLDRIGRNCKDFLVTLETLEQLGVTLHIADFGGDSMSTQGHWGKMILTILAAVAEAELGEIRDRVQKRADLKFDRGELTGNVPYGFDCEYRFRDGHMEIRGYVFPDPDTKPPKRLSPEAAQAWRARREPQLREWSALVNLHGEIVAKTLIDNPAEQEWIHRIAAWRNDHSLKAIADLLNAAQVKSKQGGQWQCGQVDSLLTSRHTAKVLNNPALAKAA